MTHIDGAGLDDSVVTASNTGPGTVLDGFTVINGTGKHLGGYTYGGGVHGSNSTLVFQNVVFRGNRASDGAGGLQVVNSNTTVADCVFEDNHGWWGGAITVDGGSASIENTLISGSGAGYGGALYVAGGAQVTIVNDMIVHNYGPPAIGVSAATAVIINSTVVNNQANGIETNSYPVGFGKGTVTVKNSILWGNNDDLVNVTATYSDIEDADPGEGNISAWPFFRDPVDQDYRIRRPSRCIDSGSLAGAPLTDFQGYPRPIDGNGDGISAVDIGADEFDPDSIPGDFGKVSPANGAIDQPSNVMLSWQASTGATGYEYCIDSSNDDSCANGWMTASGTTASLALPLGRTYYWQVRARNTRDTNEADSGAWWSFRASRTRLVADRGPSLSANLCRRLL